MKKWIFITGGIVLVLGLCAGSFYGGTVYQRGQAQQVQSEFFQARGMPPSAQGEDGFQPGQAGGQQRMYVNDKGGVSGRVKTVDGNTLTLSTAQDVTTVVVSEETQIMMNANGTMADLQPDQQVLVTGERDSSGKVNAVRIMILGEDFAGPPANP